MFKEVLLETDMKIGEICETLGYSNRNFFNKLFAEEYSITPSKYRTVHLTERKGRNLL
ncbi:MAG: AraC family transcriptional regulator [Paenibacillaceae bacterium]|nr:AraC family transcriptional regulator [Paenibacillaceae bacterium]